MKLEAGRLARQALLDRLRAQRRGRTGGAADLQQAVAIVVRCLENGRWNGHWAALDDAAGRHQESKQRVSKVRWAILKHPSAFNFL